MKLIRTIQVRSAATSAPITSFILSSPSTQPVPFTVGVGFRKGDAPKSIVANIPCQVDIKRRWSDGSVKHAVISGHCIANPPIKVEVFPGDVVDKFQPIFSARPIATVQCGDLGSVSLENLLAAPFRTWLDGPEVVECHYRASIPNTLLSVWFYVRLYVDGRMRIRVIVENGYLDAVGGPEIYASTVTIAGATAFTSPEITHHLYTAWSAEGWIGGDPQVTVTHDRDYLIATKLVPNYGKDWRPSEASLNGLVQSYAPMVRAGWTPSMGAGGFQNQIGLLPLWDAMCCTTADPRARRASEVASLALRSYPITWRDKNTHLPARPSDFLTWTVFGAGKGGTNSYKAGPLTWELNHHGSGGYLAYLLTGDYFHLETMALQSAAIYLCISYARGNGVNRRLAPGQIRGIAWSQRTIAQYTALAPDGDEVADDYRALLANDYAYWASQGPENPSAGRVGYPVSNGTYDPTRPLTAAPWQYHFWIQTNGHSWDIEPGFSDTAKHRAHRDWMYKAAVGILGGDGSWNYCFTKAGLYNITLGPMVVANYTVLTPANFYSNWGAVFVATWGQPNICSNMLEGAPENASYGYWGNLLPAISFAVDHGAPGADASWARLTGASNWSELIGSNFGAIPIFGILPRGAS